MDVSSQMTVLIGALGVFAVSWAAIHMIRAGIDYMSSRGNPRNRDSANQSVIGILIGLGLTGMGVAIVTFIAKTLTA
jgi:hypothetical protein